MKTLLRHKTFIKEATCLPDPPGQPLPTIQEYVNQHNLNRHPDGNKHRSVPPEVTATANLQD